MDLDEMISVSCSGIELFVADLALETLVPQRVRSSFKFAVFPVFLFLVHVREAFATVPALVIDFNGGVLHSLWWDLVQFFDHLLYC